MAQRFWQALADGSLLRHTCRYPAGGAAGPAGWAAWRPRAGLLLARNPRLLERLLSPYLVASQAVPVVAIAPLLVIWFGPGMFSKVLICALIVFFPVLVNTVVGLRAVPENLRDLMRSLHATRLQILRYLEIPGRPAGLPGRAAHRRHPLGDRRGGGRVCRRGPRAGLPDQRGRGQYDTALVFVAVFTLIALALALYGLVLLAGTPLAGLAGTIISLQRGRNMRLMKKSISDLSADWSAAAGRLLPARPGKHSPCVTNRPPAGGLYPQRPVCPAVRGHGKGLLPPKPGWR